MGKQMAFAKVPQADAEAVRYAKKFAAKDAKE
jgi:hypothetical protein